MKFSFNKSTSVIYLLSLCFLASEAQLNWQAITPEVMTYAVVNASEVINTMNANKIFVSGANMANLISASMTTDSIPVRVWSRCCFRLG